MDGQGWTGVNERGRRGSSHVEDRVESENGEEKVKRKKKKKEAEALRHDICTLYVC